MAQSFPETAHNKIDKKKYAENFDAIDWGDLKDKPIEKKKTKKHATAGMCGEYGTSTFNKEEYDKNFDNIDWGNKGDQLCSEN